MNNFDQKCFDLVQYFYPMMPLVHQIELAADIQALIEGYAVKREST